jgi:hypothetical protein
MTFTIRTTDVPDEACRNGILGPLVAYNESKTGRNDIRRSSRSMILRDASSADCGDGPRMTGYSWSCCLYPTRCAAVALELI